MNALELEDSIGTALVDEPFQSRLPKSMALSPGELIHLNLSIPAAVMTELCVQPALLAMKKRIAETLPPSERVLPADLAMWRWH